MVRTQNIRLPHSVVSIRCIKMSTLHCCNSVFVDLPCHLLNKLQQAACTQRPIMLHHFSSISDGCQLGFIWNWISPYFVIVLLSCCSWPCPNLSLSLCPPAGLAGQVAVPTPVFSPSKVSDYRSSVVSYFPSGAPLSISSVWKSKCDGREGFHTCFPRTAPLAHFCYNAKVSFYLVINQYSARWPITQ